MARPEELSNQPNTVEAWTTTGDRLTAIRIQGLGHFLYDLILKTEALGELHTFRSGDFDDTELSRPFADKFQEIAERYPFNASLMRHWLDLAARETAIPTLEQLRGQGFIGSIGLSYARPEDDPRVRSAQSVVEQGIDAPLREHAETYLSAESLGHPITSRSAIRKTDEKQPLENAPFLQAIFQQVDPGEEFTEEDLTLRSFIPNWTGADERFAEHRRHQLEEQKKRAEQKERWKQEGIALQQDHPEVYQFLDSGSPRLESDPFDDFSIFYRAAHELGYGVKVLERKPKDIQADENPIFDRSESKYLVMVDSPHTEAQLDAISRFLWKHKGWKFIELIDEAQSLDLLELLKGNEVRWFSYPKRFGEPVRNKKLLRRGFVRAEMRRREKFYGSDEYVNNIIANRYREVSRIFDRLTGRLGVEPVTDQELIDLAKGVILQISSRDPVLNPTNENT